MLIIPIALLQGVFVTKPYGISDPNGARMRILKEKDRVLYDKLVRLAGGDSAIVISVLSNPHRSSVDLKTAIAEIEALRNGRNPAAHPLVRPDALIPAS